MCGRFTLEPTARFYERFGIANRLPDLAPRYNIAPGQMVPVITAQHPEQLTLMRWGLIPHWAKDEKTAYKMINARAETLTTRPAYRGLLAKYRCVIPASGQPASEHLLPQCAVKPTVLNPRNLSDVHILTLTH
jgi:putative SOS response-associated peptidase YedK